MQTFALKLNHDKGKTVVRVTARNLKAAKEQLMKMEGCPESAIS